MITKKIKFELEVEIYLNTEENLENSEIEEAFETFEKDLIQEIEFACDLKHGLMDSVCINIKEVKL